MNNQHIVTFSFLDFLKAGFHSPKVEFYQEEFIAYVVILALVLKNLLILGFKSVYGILTLSWVISKADLAAESDFSFAFIPMLHEIQPTWIFFELDMEHND